MIKTGIIVEYNPFHNGHKYHIDQARSLTSCDLLIAVVSGNYNQRGDISIIDKYQKTKVALENGVDIVFELPYIFTTQNAYVFGSKAVDILKSLSIDYLVFGSETNNLEELEKIADLQVDVTKLKQLMHDGNSYPKSYGLLSASVYPNDMLAITYLKALKDTDIKPVSIQRTNDYHSNDMDIIASASAIRNAIKNNMDYKMATPLDIENPVFNDNLYPYIQKLLITSSNEDLSKFFLVSEGIENLLKENAMKYNDYEQFINASVSRRYTRSRIQRILLHIANQIKKEDVEALKDDNYLRVLGFNQKGQKFLKENKNDLNIINQFKNIPEPFKSIEWKSNLLYYSLFDDYETKIKRELGSPIILK